MNTVLHAAEHRQSHSPPAPPRAHGRVSTLDRLAMRLGLALLVWSRRRGHVDARHEARQAFERERQRELRERAAQRELLLSSVLR